MVNQRETIMLQRITLNLAREAEHPNGSNEIGYDFVAPLDRDGHLDTDGWQVARSRCRVRRFSVGSADRVGSLLHRAGGAGGATWLFDFDPNSSTDDEYGYRLETHRFKLGEYVSIGDTKRHFRTYQVVEVRPAGAL